MAVFYHAIQNEEIPGAFEDDVMWYFHVGNHGHMKFIFMLAYIHCFLIHTNISAAFIV
jgi:hypothetical protein